MGRADDRFLDDERADDALRRRLAQAGEPAFAPPPPDLISRAARRLPAAPPALAARASRRRRAARVVLLSVAGALAALAALASVADALVGRGQVALLFGDGASGLSRALLALHLLVKPALWSIGGLGAPLLAAAVVTAAVAGWLWLLLARAPGAAQMEQAP